MCLVESQGMCLVGSKDMCLVGSQGMCLVGSQDMCLVGSQDMCQLGAKTCALLRAKTCALLRAKGIDIKNHFILQCLISRLGVLLCVIDGDPHRLPHLSAKMGGRLAARWPATSQRVLTNTVRTPTAESCLGKNVHHRSPKSKKIAK